MIGPLLFNLFINDLSDTLLHTKCYLFANDVHIYISSPIVDLATSVEILN